MFRSSVFASILLRNNVALNSANISYDATSHALTVFGDGSVDKDDVIIYRGVAETITIKDQVDVIGDEAFKGFSKLTTVSISAPIKSFNISAFQNCVNLAKVDFPSALTTIHDKCFQNC